MEIRSYYQKAIEQTLKHRYFWVLALLAITADLWAVFAYNPYMTRLTAGVVAFVMLAIVVEAALIYAYIQHHEGKKTNLFDALMTAVSYIPQLLAVKVVPLILFSSYIMFLSVLGPLVSFVEAGIIEILLISLLTVIGLVLLFFIQAWSFFSICELYVHESSIGEIFSQAWSRVWKYKWHIFRICLPLIIIDLLLIVALIGVGAISYESTFFRVITGAEADRQALLLGEGAGGSAGVEFTINRLANSVFVMGFKNRGIELASAPFFMMQQTVIGVITAVLGMFLLMLRTSILTQAFLTLTQTGTSMSQTLRTSFKKA